MAVIITDMKLPKSCSDCQLLKREKMYCQLHPRKNLNVIRVVSEKPDWCPLKEVPDNSELTEKYALEHIARMDADNQLSKLKKRIVAIKAEIEQECVGDYTYDRVAKLHCIDIIDKHISGKGEQGENNE